MQGLTLVVSHSTFVNTAGPAVVWSSAVPGRLEGCTALGNALHTEAYYSVCNSSQVVHWDKAPEMLSLNASALAASPDMRVGFAGKVGLLAGIVGAGDGMEAVQGTIGDSGVMLVHAHVPPEAFAVALSVGEVCAALHRDIFCQGLCCPLEHPQQLRARSP